jgi:hypothetical protein
VPVPALPEVPVFVPVHENMAKLPAMPSIKNVFFISLKKFVTTKGTGHFCYSYGNKWLFCIYPFIGTQFG